MAKWLNERSRLRPGGQADADRCVAAVAVVNTALATVSPYHLGELAKQETQRMNTTDSTDPPDAQRRIEEDRTICHTCGSAIRKAWRHRPDGRLHEMLVCVDPDHFVSFVPKRAKALFVGWYRPRKGVPWEAVTTGETEAAGRHPDYKPPMVTASHRRRRCF